MPTNVYETFKKIETKKPKMKLSDVFTHVMPNGDIHSGKTHTKNSKLIKKKKPKSKKTK